MIAGVRLRNVPATKAFRRYNSYLPLNKLDVKWAKKWKELTSQRGLNPKKYLVDPNAESFYALVMFPYPSGILHMGHVRVYTISDVITRYKRLQGMNVIHPMGWDAFGLPAENAAIERGISPIVWTDSNIEKMKQQMELVLADFDWERELATCKPDYYKWTQNIFLLLYKHGLAYKKKAEINWDPVDQTVLANEQVDANGNSWRSGAKVEKRELSQWFIGITKYAQALNQDLQLLEKWPEKVKLMQKNWIGESHGFEFNLPTDSTNFPSITVFTSRPETIFSVQFLALSSNHPIVVDAAKTDSKLQKFIKDCENADQDSKDGYLLASIKASIPINSDNTLRKEFQLPVYVAPYVLSTYGSGAVMGCPAHDERDYEFWKKHNPNVQPVVTVGPSSLKPPVEKWTIPYTSKNGILYDSNSLPNSVADLGVYRGLTCKDAAEKVSDAVESLGIGSRKTNFRIRDWLISRQRYWGAPIPIVYCDSCGTVPVPDKDLPVELPFMEDNKFGKGNPLEQLESFYNTTCPSCGGHAKRDTDTMDTFMDSSWYFFRYLDSKNESAPFDTEVVSKHLPVDMYIGGIEHAILHLLYTRFISKFLGDIGLWEGSELNNEPIVQLVTQGMVQGLTYTDPDSGKFLKPEEVDITSTEPKIIATGRVPSLSYEKMSKSKYNGVDPAETVKKYGADATRAHILFQAPISDSLNWNEEQIQGVDRWLRRVISLHKNVVEYSPPKTSHKRTDYYGIELNGEELKVPFADHEVKFFNEFNTYIDKIDKSINVNLTMNTIISDLMKYTNALSGVLKDSKKSYNKDMLLDAYKKLLIIMSPVAPSVAEQAWELLIQRLGNSWASITLQNYPKYQQIKSDNITYNVFINGNARLLFSASKDLISKSDDEILDSIFANQNVQKFASRDSIKKIIKKPGMVSLVSRK